MAKAQERVAVARVVLAAVAPLVMAGADLGLVVAANVW